MNFDETAKVLTLDKSPEYRSQFLKLIEDVFPKGAPVSRKISSEQEFPLLLQTSNGARNVFFVDESAPKTLSSYPVVAAASYRVFDFYIPQSPHPLKIAGIGLVVTHPQYQGKGLGQLIQAQIESHAQKEGATISVLWSDLVQFYSKLGYLIAGSELQWQLDRSELDLLKERIKRENTSNIKVERLESFSTVAAFYKKYGVGPKRDTASYDPLFSLPNSWAYVARNESNEIMGYGILGKGRDLRDTVHELIGDKSAMAPLLNALSDHSAAGLRVHQPGHSPLEEELTHWIGPAKKEAMSFFKVLSGPKLVEWFAKSRYLPTGIGISAIENGFTLRNRHITFFESQDYGHLLQLFFGPWNLSELEELPSGFTDQFLLQMKPIEIYFWGFDSV